MPLNISYPSSVNTGGIISLRWSNTFNDDYFTVSRQVNYNSAWEGTGYPPGSNLTRTSDLAEATWERVRYRVSGHPSGAISTTNWITVVGGVDPGDPDPGDPDPGDPDPPDPIVWTPTVLTPSSVTAGSVFQINWADSNTGANYDVEESVDGGSYTRIATGHLGKWLDRTAPQGSMLKYRVRAIIGVDASPWGYSADVIIAPAFPNLSAKIGGAVKNSVDGWVKINGELRKITGIWVKINGELRQS